MIQLTTPISEETARSLKVGDEVGITGVLFTGRDAVHKYLHEGGQLPAGVNLAGGILYHCGPVVIKDHEGNWKCVAAGPTTSIREEPYQWQVIRDLGRAVSSAKAAWVSGRSKRASNTVAFIYTPLAERRRCSPSASCASRTFT